ncbi:hypothetical protein RIR_jg12147.t1 [Rhizophagus irregularis DAOM 181602=DAOM 197198]|nr:hypothetical protein RIR_jg12147.t1 [Rhizophagus irregularis DAOM 181602=DAOM 197198]
MIHSRKKHGKIKHGSDFLQGNLYDGRVEKKRQSMKLGELDEKINNNSADLLEHMIQACNDPENPTLTSEELRDVQKKVRDEILRVLDDYLMPSVEQQKELKYMNIKISQLPRRFNLGIGTVQKNLSRIIITG